MRCPRCGNENPGTNRFCGMCGTILLPAPVPVAAGQGAAATTATRPTAPGPVTPAPISPASPSQNQTAAQPALRSPQPEPTISGPSFLGLNQPAPSSTSERRRGSLSIDPNSSSRDLDYLLEDDHPKGGSGKYILILIALLLAAGFGYLRWRQQGFAWLTAGSKKPTASIQEDQPDNATPGQNSSTSSPSPAPADQASSSQPAANTSAPANSASAPATGAPPSNASAPQPSASTGPPNSDPAPPSTAPPAAKKSDDTQDDNADSDSGDDAAPDTAPATKPKNVPADAASKPSPAPRTRDVVAEAHKYLYGTGARQDCDRGMRLLKPAADHADAKAMVEMGALYSAGLCAPRDLPTAYRWFAMALRKQPDNASVQTDLQKLWGEMTQPERQLAIKLSQ